MKKRVLILGGTTFVSKMSAKYFIEKGYEVSILTRGKKEVDYLGVSNHFKMDRKDIKSLEGLKDKEFDIIIDASAYVLEDVENIFKVLKTKKLKKYIFVSSGAVYSKSTDIAMSEDYSVGENPNWGSYGLNKLKIEEFLIKKYKEEKLPVSIVRPTYLYGEENILFRESYFFGRIDKLLEIPIPDSDSKIQFILIDDLMKIFDSLIDNENTNGEAFNVTNPTVYSFENMIREYSIALKKDVLYKKVNYKDKYIDRDFFPYRDTTYILDVEKSKKFGVYIPKTSLVDGLRKTYQWYKESSYEFKDERMNKVEEVLLEG